jgi:hypothetical protein
MQRDGGSITPALTESRRLRGKLELVLPALMATGRQLIDHPELRRIYPEFLIMAHGIVRASVPLMETAFAATRALTGDAVAAQLAGYFEHHIPEEREHDEWILADLEFIGVSRAQVLRRTPSPTVAALVGSQYYWMLHAHPVALLGYIMMLEGYPPSPLDIEQMETATGYGPEAFRTILFHADLDTGHGDDLDALLDSLPVTEQQRALMGISAISSVQLLTQAEQELLLVERRC